MTRLTIERAPDGFVLGLQGTRRRLAIVAGADMASVAQCFGWAPERASGRTCCRSMTDGSVTCSLCGTRPEQYATSASEWLHERTATGPALGTEDPGFFDD